MKKHNVIFLFSIAFLVSGSCLLAEVQDEYVQDRQDQTSLLKDAGFLNVLNHFKKYSTFSSYGKIKNALSGTKIIKMYNLLGVLAAKDGYYAEAQKYYELAIKNVAQTDNAVILSDLLENYAAVLIRANQHEKAEEYFRLIKELYKRMDKELPYTLKNNMGTNAFLCGEYKKSFSLHQEAIADVLQKKKRFSKQDIALLYNLAWDYCALDQIEKAIKFLQEAKKYIPSDVIHNYTARLLYLKSMISSTPSLKKQIIDMSKSDFIKQEDVRIFLSLAKAEIAKRENRWSDVAQELIDALKLQHPDILLQYNNFDIPPTLQTYKARCAAIADAYIKSGKHQEAWTWIQRISNQAEKEILLRGNTAELTDVLSCEEQLLKQEADLDNILNLEKEYEKAKNKLKEKNYELWQTLFSQRVNIHPDDLDQIRHALPEKILLVENAIIGDNIVFFICEKSQPVKMIFLQKKNVGKNIKRFIVKFKHIMSSPANENAAKDICRQLYNILFLPIKVEIERRAPKAILWSPTGILRYIPASALYDGTEYLCQKYLFSNVSGYDILRISRSEKKSKLNRFVGFANPDGSLPETETECDEIANMFEDSTILRGKSATRDKFLKFSDNVDCIHVATHGVLNAANPSESYILFADQPLLYSEMIAGLPFMKDLYMLTFSACNTAAISGTNDNALEIYGMAYQFIRKSNSGATLATLWPVSDTHTSKFMSSFYKNLLDGTRQNNAFNRASALNYAQRMFLTSKETSHPFYWAAFILIGNFN